MSHKERDPAAVMLMMDGKLLTVNFLLCALRRIAIRDLGLEPGDSIENEEATAKEIQALVVKMCVIGLRDTLDDKQRLGWDTIRDISQSVVDLVNEVR